MHILETIPSFHEKCKAVVTVIQKENIKCYNHSGILAERLKLDICGIYVPHDPAAFPLLVKYNKICVLSFPNITKMYITGFTYQSPKSWAGVVIQW